MFRIIRQLFGSGKSTPQANEECETTLVYVRVKPDQRPAIEAENQQNQLSIPAAAKQVAPQIAAGVQPIDKQNRQRARRRKTRRPTDPRTPLAKLAIFSPKQIKLLRRIDCTCDIDLRLLDTNSLAKRLANYQSSRSAAAEPLSQAFAEKVKTLVRRGRWALRFADQFDDMKPRESLLLRAVHRGGIRTLAQDSAGMIRRDLQRLALSSRGQRILTLDEIPEMQRVKAWIAEARKLVDRKSSPESRFRVRPSIEDSQPDVPLVPR